MSKLKVINLLAGPGARKSTTAYGLAFEMKDRNFSVELASEYAKDKVYEGHLGCLSDQIYIFGKQQRRISRLVDNVEWAITDSPLLLSILYNETYSDEFNELVMQEYNKYENYNFFMIRPDDYCEEGRVQNREQAEELDWKMLDIIRDYDIPIIDNIKYSRNAPLEILTKLGLYTEL